MAALTDQQLLEATREAIDALTLGGVTSYAIGNRQVTKHNLPELWAQVERLESRIRRASAGGMFGVSRFMEPR